MFVGPEGCRPYSCFSSSSPSSSPSPSPSPCTCTLSLYHHQLDLRTYFLEFPRISSGSVCSLSFFVVETFTLKLFVELLGVLVLAALQQDRSTFIMSYRHHLFKLVTFDAFRSSPMIDTRLFNRKELIDKTLELWDNPLQFLTIKRVCSGSKLLTSFFIFLSFYILIILYS